MKTKLSHSACSRYQLCPKSYELHYIKKIRSNVTSAALIFGSALDNALNFILLGKEGAEEELVKSFTTAYVNSQLTHIPNCIHLVYADSDYDEELLPAKISEAQKERYKELRAIKKEKGYKGLSDKEVEEYNLLNWESLLAKGLIMLREYRKQVMPKLLKVHEVQKQVSLQNESGDEVTGYIDLIAEVEGYGTVVLDNKTSAMEYEDDAVLTSPQLSLYVHMVEQQYATRKAGFIVLRKQVIKNRKKTCSKCGHDGSGGRAKTCDNVIAGKRCGGEWHEEIDPTVNIQFIVDDIPEQTEQLVLENFDDVNQSIKTGHFTRNLNSCNNQYGAPCIYRDYCFRGSKKGLTGV